MRAKFMDVGAPPLFVLLWSSAFIAAIIGIGAAPPMLVLFVRFGVGGLALTLYAVAVKAVWPRGRQLWHTAVAGLLMQMMQFGGFYTAMRYHVTGALVSLIQGLNPVVIALLAGAVLGERVSSRQWLGFAIGGVGVGMAVTDQSHLSVAGMLWSVVGLLGLSLGTLYQKRFTPTIDSRAGTAVHVLASAPVAGVLMLLSHNMHVAHPGQFALAMGWIVVMNSMAAFLLLNAMLSRWATTRVAKLFFAVPAVTTIMAWLVVDQRPHPLTIAGLAVGLAGLVLAARAPRAATPSPVPEQLPVAGTVSAATGLKL